ncbi:glycosyltransferase family 39 protein [Bdellovibrio sp. HCB-110]|uniref:glycosyltransferase family 39 protein n=1 Tax=Bdellovibrio sp. HCB-110 TaxID=3391182 RepID=UPI0039B605F8
MEIQTKTRTANFLFIVGLCGILLALYWFHYLTPRPENIRFIHPNLTSTESAPSTLTQKTNRKGLYWLSFDTSPRFFAVNSLRMRTLNCVRDLRTNHQSWNLPENLHDLCNNKTGLPLRNTAETLSKETTWHIAGSTRTDIYGILLNAEWTEPYFVLGLIFLIFSLALALYAKLPLIEKSERLWVTVILSGALFLRFWFVFILSPPEMSLYSDMGGYFHRALEIDRGIFDVDQLFQPIGFTLWSLWVRKIGGFELLNWTQVFFSWGTVLLIFLMVRERFGKLAGFVSLLVASFHIAQAAMASLHMAEMAYTFFITLTLWFILRTLKNEKLIGFFIIGVLMTVAFYFKGNHSFFIPVFSLWLLYQNRDQLFAGVRKVSLMAVGCLVVVIPHLVWTGIHYAKPHIGPTAGALNFVEGKCPSKENMDSHGHRWMSPLFGITGETTFKKWPRPFTDQKYFWKEGGKCVIENPAVLVSSLRYIYYLFGGNALWPIVTTPLKVWYFPWAQFFAYVLLPFSVLGALTLSRRKDTFTEVSALMMLTLFFTVWFFKSENRFRVPFDAILIVWGSVGFAWAVEKIKAWLPLRTKLSSAFEVQQTS